MPNRGDTFPSGVFLHDFSAALDVAGQWGAGLVMPASVTGSGPAHMSSQP